MALEPFDLPWLLPGIAVAAVVAATLAGRLGRALGAHPVVGAGTIFGFGLVLAATLTPLDASVAPVAHVPLTCDLSRFLPASPTVLLRGREAAQNVLLLMPLGLSIGAGPRTRRMALVLCVAVALPFFVEGVQFLITPLHRACESADVADNLTGLACGLVLGTVLRALVHRASSRR